MSSFRFTTGKCRLSYVHLFQPHADLSGNEKYSVSLIIPKSDEKNVDRYKALMDQMMKDAEIKNKLKGNGSVHMPLRDGDLERSNDAAYENNWYINAKSNPDHKPRVYIIENGKPVEALDPNDIYSGCYAQAILNFYAYNKGGNKGIGCSVAAVFKVADGQPLTGSSVSGDDFDASLLGEDVDKFFN